MATATATSRLEQDRQRLEASYKAPSSKQMRAEPHPTYVSAAWVRDHPEYAAQAVSGPKTILNVMDALIAEEQTCRFVADKDAPEYVKRVAEGLNGIGSTCNHATQGVYTLTKTAFNFAKFLIDSNRDDEALVRAMMDLFGTVTNVITAPVKATLAVMLVNMYPGMGIEFNYAAPQKAANNINRFNRISPKRGLTDEEQRLIDGTSQGTVAGDNPNVLNQYELADTPDYAAEVAAQKER
jgi:hypothetical protein